MRPTTREPERNGTSVPLAPAGKGPFPNLVSKPAEGQASRRRRWLSRWVLFYAILIVGVACYVALVLAPGYASPRSRVYSGPLGYPSVMRALHKPIEVDVAEVKVRPMVRTISAEGYVGYLNEAAIRSEVLGIVTDVLVEPGQEVRKGEVLLRLHTGEHATRADELQLELRRVAIKLAKVDLERTIRLAQSSAASTKDVEEAQLRHQQAVTSLELAEENYKNSLLSRSKIVVDGPAAAGKAGAERRIDILATVAGTIFERNVQPGENLTALTGEKDLLYIGDRLVFQAEFDQRYADSVRLGDRAKFHLRAYPGATFDAEVVRIAHQVKPVNQKSDGRGLYLDTFRVWLAIRREATEGKKLIRGMNGYCIFQRGFTAPAIPESALMRYSGRTGTVLTVDANSRLQVRNVTYSGAEDGCVAIESGLAEGDLVVLEGQGALKPGDEVTARRE
jgi:multidrug efflux pump subunit AcrA (membrane-fusion protein)